MQNTGKELLLVDIEGDSDELLRSRAQIDEELDRVNRELEYSTVNASKQDYALAMASGILAGAVDSMFVGNALLFEGLVDKSNLPVKAPPVSMATQLSFRELLENKLPTGIDLPYSTIQDRSLEHLGKFANESTVLGLAASIAVQALGASVSNNGDKSPLLLEIGPSSLQRILGPAAVVGFLKWMNSLPKTVVESEETNELPKAMRGLALIASENPIVGKLAIYAERWAEELCDDLVEAHKDGKAAMTSTAAILLLAEKFVGIPEVANTDLALFLTQMQEFAPIVPVSWSLSLDALGKQAIPVLLNETIVRTAFFITRFMNEWQSYERTGTMDWSRVVPFGNRTVERMITIASMTLSVADTADAAVRAAIESAGSSVIFSQRFIARYNYVATGRAIVAVVREVTSDANELELLRKRRMLTEARAQIEIERIKAYMAALQERLDEYIEADLQAFFEGFSLIDQGLIQGDSNLVIAGNVVIQQQLGQEVQFTNQDEFDYLMESDDDFVL